MTEIMMAIAAARRFVPAEGRRMQWVHLAPIGAVDANDGRSWRLEKPAAVIAASNTRDGLPVDFDHASDRIEEVGTSPAAGWIMALEARDDGIWGLVEWTELGETAIADRQYRFISPVFEHTRDGRVIRFLRAGLTNTPALSLTALASSEDTGIADTLLRDTVRDLVTVDDDADDAAFGAALRAVLDTARALRRDLAGILSLEEDADNAAILSAVRDLGASARPGDGAGESGALATLAASFASERHKAWKDTMIAAASRAGKLPPALHGWASALCDSNPESFEAFLHHAPSIVTPGALLDGQPPASDRPVSGADITAAICGQLGLKAGDLQ